MLARDNTSLVRLAQKTPIHAAPKELSNNTRLELPGTNAVPRGLRVGSARRQAPPNKYGEKNLRSPPRKHAIHRQLKGIWPSRCSCRHSIPLEHSQMTSSKASP